MFWMYTVPELNCCMFVNCSNIFLAIVLIPKLKFIYLFIFLIKLFQRTFFKAQKTLNYILKLKSTPINPAYNSIFKIKTLTIRSIQMMYQPCLKMAYYSWQYNLCTHSILSNKMLIMCSFYINVHVKTLK